MHLYKVVLCFESLDGIPKFDLSNNKMKAY